MIMFINGEIFNEEYPALMSSSLDKVLNEYFLTQI